MPDESLTFAHPLALLLLVALAPLIALRARSLRFRNRAVNALVAPRLRGRLLIGDRPGAHWGRYTLQLIALALLVVALAGPRYGSIEETTVAEGRNIIIGIDTSRSMLATDLQPDRLTRAKLAAHDLMNSLPGDRIGLIAFAGSSFLQAPLTVDHDAVMESISQLDTEIIPRGGTNIGRALTLARETFAETGTTNNAFILFSDGEDLESEDLPAAALADPEEDARVTVIAIGTGTTAGSIIPDPAATTPGSFIRDSSGEIVRSRLDASGLRDLADATGGLYLDLNSTDAMQKVVAGALERLERSTMEGRTVHKPIERFRWALLPALLLLITSLIPLPSQASAMSAQLRTPSEATPAAIGLTLISLLLANEIAHATPLEAWQRFQAGDFENAAKAYEQSLEKNSLHPADELQ